MATIKLTNGVLLDSNSVKIGIDASNVLASNQYDYTATQDCWMMVFGGTNTGANQCYLIDGVQIQASKKDYFSANFFSPIFIRKGQNVKISKNGTSADTGISRLAFYGTK